MDIYSGVLGAGLPGYQKLPLSVFINSFEGKFSCLFGFINLSHETLTRRRPGGSLHFTATACGSLRADASRRCRRRVAYDGDSPAPIRCLTLAESAALCHF